MELTYQTLKTTYQAKEAVSEKGSGKLLLSRYHGNHDWRDLRVRGSAPWLFTHAHFFSPATWSLDRAKHERRVGGVVVKRVPCLSIRVAGSIPISGKKFDQMDPWF